MKRRPGIALLAVLAIVGAALWLLREPGGGASHITIADAWARPASQADGAAAVYLRIENAGGDRLTGIETPVADKAAIHESRMEGDIMRMRSLDSVDIAAGGHVAFAPGGLHIMLTGLKQSLAEGDRFPLILVFAKAGRIEAEVAVRSQAPDMAGHGAMEPMPGMPESKP